MSTLGIDARSTTSARPPRVPWWFQLYVQADRGFTAATRGRRRSRRGDGSGAHRRHARCSARATGTDGPGGHTVDGMQPPALAGAAPSVAPAGEPASAERIYNPHLDPSLTWETLEWLVDLSPVPVLAKGVVRADDAHHCVDAGAGGVIVSNHGARNLDTVVATAEALPGVVRAVDGAVPVLVDGGIRRGTDVAKALILGADAVLVGRPTVWGLTVAGADGVQWVVETLWSELAMAMGLLGAASVDDLTPDLIWPTDATRQSVTPGVTTHTLPGSALPVRACRPPSASGRRSVGRCRSRSRSRRRHAGRRPCRGRW